MGWWHPREVRTLQLKPGRYVIVAVGATAIPFTVDPTGVVDYDPALTYVSGRGTHTLTLSGLPITIDGTALAYQYVAFSSATPWMTNTRQTLRLLPGRYTFYGAGATGVPITFDPTGTIDYDPQYTYVSGRGTNTLTLSGLLITVDATRLNTQAFGITPATGWLDARRPQTFRLLPGSYRFYVAYVRYFAVTLTTAGTFDYDPTLAGVSGRGTATLTIN